GAVQELGAVLGPVLGAVILSVSGWRAIFWAGAGLGLVLFAGLRFLARPSRTPPPSGPPRLAPCGVDAASSGLTHVITSVDPHDAASTSQGHGGLRWVRRVLLSLAAVLAGLTLVAPDRLVTDVTLGLPFVPFGESTSRVVTPIGVLTGLVVLAVVVLTARRWWPVFLLADGLGALLLAVALGCLVLTFSTSDPEREVVGPLGFALLPLGALAFVLYLWRHRVAADPLVRRGVLRGRGWAAFAASLLVGVALVAVIVDVPLLARLTLTSSQGAAAFILVRFLVAVPVGALLGGLLLRRLGEGTVAAAGLAAAAAGLVVMSTWGRGSLVATTPATTTLALVGLGLGLALAPVNAAALAAAPEDAHGVASALVVVARMVGMVIGLAVLTAVGLHRYVETVATLRAPDPAALVDAALIQVRTVFAGGAVAAGLAAVVALALGVRRPAGADAPSGDLSRT
ncbi:MAG: MFS transporter, partial [Lapillicoccus sp.]